MTLSRGSRLGAYELTTLIGSGGMGEVYRAADSRLGRDVAVKVLPPALTQDPDAVARFQREARAVAALSHPNIVNIFDIGSEQGVWYVVTELLEGATLRERLASGGFEPRVALTIALEVARGLAAAHQKGIIHRDLKPENIFMTDGGAVKILDFGIARRLGVEADATVAGGALTIPGIVVGTVGYMAPEQVRGLPTTTRSDVFSFGTVLYEMLAGRRAFTGDTSADAMAAIVRDEPAELLPSTGVAPSVAALVRRCLAKEPAGRYASGSELVAAIEAVGLPTGSATRATTSDSKSIVVLPFDDISPGSDNAFFADGLTEEIISDLSKIHGLRVISRTSSMQLKGRLRDIPTIARELNVHYVLEGSVRKAGDRLRITAQLVDAASDAQLWSEKYNGTLDDIFEIQEQVARAIVDGLHVRLTPEESREIARRPIEDPRAYECCLRARSEIARFTPTGAERALADVERGLELTGENAALLGVQGDAYWQYFNLGLTSDPAHLDRIADVARRLERLEGGAGHAQRLFAIVASHRGDMREAILRIGRAVELEPADTFSLVLFTIINLFTGRMAHAARSTTRLNDLDPLLPFSRVASGATEFMSGRAAASLPHVERAYRLDPSNPAIGLMHIQILAANERTDEAIAASHRLEAQGADHWTWLCSAFRLGLERNPQAIQDSLTAERRAWVLQDLQYPLNLAEAFAVAGADDAAFEWLEYSVSRGTVPYHFLAHHDPFLSWLRTDARWDPLMARVRQRWEEFAALP